MNVVHQVRHLFEHDDGSLPDIYIEGLKPAEIVSLYALIRSRSKIFGAPTVWNIAQAIDVPLRDIANPAQSYVQGEIEAFRHGLVDLTIDGMAIQNLAVSMEPNGISFDYRMGPHWSEQVILALLKFIAEILRQYPEARVRHVYEGLYDQPNAEFEEAINAVSRAVA